MSTFVHKPLPKHYSTSRALRNEAERQRRDKLNHYVSELAALVPFITNAKKRVDKTSILRLAASYIRLHKVLNKPDKKLGNLQLSLNNGEALRNLFNSIGGFLLVLTSTGKVVYVSEAIEDTFGYSQNDVLGQCFYSIIHADDAQLLRQQLQPKDSPRRSFYCRLMEKNLSRNDKSKYQIIHVMGHMKEYSSASEERDPSTEKLQLSEINFRRSGRRKYSRDKVIYHDEESGDSTEDSASNSSSSERGLNEESVADSHIFVAFVKVVRDRLVTELTWVESMREEYITRHRLNGCIAYSDHRISYVTGLMPEEVIGKSAFDYMHPNDVCWSLLAQKQMLGNSQGQGMITYRLNCKDGSYVTLRSRGFMEVNKDTGKVDTFICINTVVSTHTAEEEVKNQRKKLLPYLKENASTDMMQNIGNGLPPEIKAVLDNRKNLLQNFMSSLQSMILTGKSDEDFDAAKPTIEKTSQHDPQNSFDSFISNGVTECEEFMEVSKSKKRSSNEMAMSSKLRRRSSFNLERNNEKTITFTEPMRETVSEPLRETFTEPMREAFCEPIREIFTEPTRETFTESVRNTFIEPMLETSTGSMQETLSKPIQEINMNNHASVMNNIKQVPAPQWVFGENSSTSLPNNENYFSSNIQPSYSQIENWGYPNWGPDLSCPSNISNDSQSNSSSLLQSQNLPAGTFEFYSKRTVLSGCLPSDNYFNGISDSSSLVNHSSNTSVQNNSFN